MKFALQLLLSLAINSLFYFQGAMFHNLSKFDPHGLHYIFLAVSYSSEAGNESILNALWEKYENTSDKVINAADLLAGSPMLYLVPCHVALTLYFDTFHSQFLFYFILFSNEKCLVFKVFWMQNNHLEPLCLCV